MKLVVSQLVSTDNALHLRREVAVEKNEPGAFDNAVHAFHTAEVRAEQHFDAKLPRNLKGVACAAAPHKPFADL